MPTNDTDLTKVPTKDLMNEMARRSEAFVFAGRVAADNDPKNVSVVCLLVGDLLLNTGLAVVVMERIAEERTAQRRRCETVARGEGVSTWP